MNVNSRATLWFAAPIVLIALVVAILLFDLPGLVWLSVPVVLAIAAAVFVVSVRRE
ncbi:DUF4175 domain-containing protein [Curtobacterium sp. MCPF17_021]|uniref:DUF4175 domain-containing protein n=1 Tax=Curtobacterium sp. MCPF17_021 TaxID=2175639 RepID=UPI0011B47FE1|nr:DUF4175 domain-containing protein [Curtobacterium sp. MCPF17_021]WIE83506.1 hypothetical protein DEJ29_001325 [Curtobacterium sp. MCPF17_021]